MAPKQLFLLMFFFLNTTVAICKSHLSNETDHQALLAFRNSIIEDPLNVLSSWNTSLNFCQWKGITCGARHRRVVAITLPSMSLGGTLPPDIGNLSFLQTISLEVNNFKGPIPREISRLFRLTELSLANNSFQGGFPENLSRCSNLELIDISFNDLEGEIPPELGKLSRLSSLILFVNNFTGKIPSLFGNLSNLQVLSLGRNNLDGNIPAELGLLSKLYYFQLGANYLSGSIPPSLFNLSSIENFVVADNNLTGSLPSNLGFTLPNLQGIYLSINQFHGVLPSSLANASGLGVVDIQNNSFMGPLPTNFGSLHNLQTVNFIFNSFGGNLEDFIQSLSDCSNLNILAFDYNNLGSTIPRSIGNLSMTLTWLSMSSTNLTGTIPREIGKLSGLSYLSVDGNMLTGNIPSTIGNLSNIERLYFYENEISGEIPFSFGNLAKLTILSGRKNILNGTIPSSMGNCTNMQGISLGWNRFSGPLPIQLFNIFSLSYGILLNNNLFTGTLPMQVGNLKNLGSLDVSYNQLSGDIPSTLGSCQVLETVYLQGNFFNGSIPDSFSQLKGIQVLDLSNNRLSGQIPLLLTELTFKYLNISYNSFDGEVPTEGVFKNVTAFSVVGNNELCGGIEELQLPSCPVKGSSRKRKEPVYRRVIVPLAITIPIVFLLLLFVLAYFVRRYKVVPSSAPNFLKNYPKLSYGELSISTSGFSSSNLVGEGRYGSVYRGTLSVTNEMVAVKVLILQQKGADKSFMAECEALRSIRHRNLIKIITSCSSIDFKGESFKALVYEFMPNGNLESWLHPSLSQETVVLTFLQRLNIAIDVATALDYLHNYCEPAIVHCDIKPGNILLDNDMCARVSDFGLAKILLTASGESNHQSSSVLIRGTIGYVAPEYAISFEVSKEGDIYSYGILLLEMFTGKRPTNSSFVENTNLPDYVRVSLQNQVMETIDPQILLEDENESARENNNSKKNICLRSILEIGILCSKEQPRERMDAKNVLVELHKIRNAYVS